MRLNNKAWLIAGGASLVLASCGGGEQGGLQPAPGPRGERPTDVVTDVPVKIGQPYDVGGTMYTPEDALGYDEVGYATWYGDELAGANTANGERFVPTGISAAHKTLPLPSYVEVTSLDTGKTILVRINDRGPFTNDKIIDLSRGAAEQLGIMGAGSAAVRVRRVSPPEQERAVLRAHGRAAERLETPSSLLAVLRQRLGGRSVVRTSVPAPRPVKPARPAKPVATAQPGVSYDTPPGRKPEDVAPPPQQSGEFIVEEAGARRSAPPPQAAPPRADPPVRALQGGYVVQVAAFSSRSRAQELARRIGGSAVEGGGVWRVRYGPYPTQDAAQQGVRQAAGKGYENARIMANDAP